MQLNARGQTLPFWSIGTLIVLALLFFVSNAASMVVWQIRAQNAADSFAAQALGIQANLYNEYSTLTYAAGIDEYRLRYLNQAILNTIDGVGGCTPQAGGTCDSDYQALVSEYASAAKAYDNIVQLMRQGDNVTQAGVQADQQKAMKNIGLNCYSTSDYTCAFGPYAVASNTVKGNVTDEVDMIACKNVSYFAPQLLHLGRSSFLAVGRGAAAVLPGGVQSFHPGSTTNTLTGKPFQPLETPAPDRLTPYEVDFSGMTANVNWYIAAPIRPFGGSVSAAAYSGSCT